ncbi:hypothetical protein THTE_1767 [Thermogutta terrifontis]|uniref:Uncharacterized protein n=1 Tax=Thermogutta terrifontis TaxID=1331910 RepID=A0A286REH9_9BACT|nr:hypothetical protein THTE_1767 [Thermogutta terrifontis]
MEPDCPSAAFKQGTPAPATNLVTGERANLLEPLALRVLTVAAPQAAEAI